MLTNFKRCYHQTVDLAPLLEQRRFRGIEVFGLACAEHAPAEADRRTAYRKDREHHPVAEAIVTLAFVLDHQPALNQRLVVVFRKRRAQRLPVVGRVADAEARRDLAGQSATLQVLDRARRFLQLRAVELHGALHHRVKVGFALAARRLLRRRRPELRHLHARHRGEILHRIDVTEARIRHQEADRVAMRAATEAVIELLGGADRERRRLLVVEGAQPREIGAALLQLDVARDDIDDVDAVQKVLLEAFGDHGTAALPLV